MNWIDTPYDTQAMISDITHLGRDYRDKGFTNAVLLGMGGSSLAPEVISKILGTGEQGLNLKILDSTDPEQVKLVAESSPAKKTLYIVASKSGTTGEINAFLDYFWRRTKGFDPQNTGAHFIAITDPGTKLANLAESRNFSGIFLGDPQVGGRNSALTAFGIVPAALLGINLGKFTQNAVNMADMCNEGRPLSANLGIVLGAILGAAALEGKNKVTLITDEKWAPFGDWLEQLVAESSGKNGKGILPVANEPEMSPADYRHDRIFIHLEQSEEKHDFVERLKQAGHPVISLHVDEDEDLAGQFYLWEIAVATACAVIGVNSFDQPDVQDAKLRTLAGLDEFRKRGKFPEVESSVEFPDAKILTTLPSSLDASGSLHQLVEGFVEHYLKKTEYIAINAFLPKKSENEVGLQEFRRQLGEKYHLATTLGFGPRYLHSTGQFHKGGPNTGLFLLITAQREKDLGIPGQGISFGVMQRAQAIGDLQALQGKARNVLWIDLSAPDVSLLLKN
jgi:transaldolase/glucose-6-phosphate isomerase